MAKKIVPQEPCAFCGHNPCVCGQPQRTKSVITSGSDCGATGPDCECHDTPMLCTRKPGHSPSNAHYNLPHKKSWSKDRA